MANNVSSFDIRNKGIHISENVNGLYEIAKSNAFDLLIPTDDLLKSGIIEDLATEDDYLQNVQDVIRIAVESSFVPHSKVSPIEVKRGNSTIKYAGTPSWESGQIKCTDFVGAKVKDVLMALYHQVYDENTDVVKLASNYKHDWTLVEYSGDFSQIIRTWTLKGAWISGISEDDFTHENGDSKRSISVTVEYDRAIFNSELQ